MNKQGNNQQVEPWLSHSDLDFKGWCGVDKMYLLVKFDRPAMRGSGQTGFVPQTACDLYFREIRSQ